MHNPRKLLLVLSAAFVGLTLLGSCTHACGLSLRGTQNVQTTGDNGVNDHVPCCGGFYYKDLPLLPVTDGAVNVRNVLQPAEPVDAFLVPTSCTLLFGGTYPGSPPLCQVFLGPVGAKSESGQVKLNQGTYRLWMQAYSTNTASYSYWASIDVLDYQCLPSTP